ncbi:hypothetical protein [Stenotrophomonas sp. YAU14D1_LEIMI4_1]|uniref:hypothetical protein n=1 Tax=Stenotrophomonas sp. YAU14D1_LEIMI4_1 TaxID=2072407 RepID=UPI000D540AE8|nr:hypothetical protein [Stenotrophomonas sp. YAU14D1_LEIMI4_1]AWH26001.1 hypothetical protein C1932_13330 [Stenotrophomonas sp. YAU14D1_LEIMI4_1]
MVITVQCHAQRWSLIDPRSQEVQAFDSGAVAFDTAAAHASEHHHRTGQSSTVRVAALGNAVDALRFGH